MRASATRVKSPVTCRPTIRPPSLLAPKPLVPRNCCCT
jgi:hypothetical protein